jgi:hypothetical protein
VPPTARGRRTRSGRSRSPSSTRSTLLRIFERIGQQVQALGVPGAAEFTSASALLNYILGVGGLNAANARTLEQDTDRADFLATASAEWAGLDPDEYPFIRNVAGQLPGHDDREQFLTGIRALGRRPRSN